MIELYEEALKKMLTSFARLAEQLDLPELVTINGGYTYRYKNKSVHVALVLKLARVITGLQAIFQLNRLGLVQEQAALQRIEDELTEDISFLSFSIIFDDTTEMHTRYLEAFFEEEIEDGKTAIESAQRRPMIPRKKIQAYITKDRGTEENQGSNKEASRTLSKAYSGYVHAAAPHIMELYYGNPPEFHLTNALQSPLYEDHVEDMLNYFYRGILAFAFTSKAFGNEKLFTDIFEYSKEFARKSGSAEHLTPYVY